MKKILYLILVSLISGSFAIAQPATDFTATDCNSVSHNFFSELNTGKVIVLNWVMPCTTCIPASLAVSNIVQGYASSNPGQVLQYLIDDDGAQSCATLNNWANTNGISPNEVFKNLLGNEISQTPYGGEGMPHVVVVGPDHNIYFNGIDAAAENPTAITNAINQSLLASGVQNASGSLFHLSVAVQSEIARVNYSLSATSKVVLEMLNETGQRVFGKELGRLSAGNNSSDFELEGIAAGIYFIRLSAEAKSQTVRFSYAR